MESKTTIIEAAARCAHEVNRAYCAARGDDSQTSWEDAPAWQRESAIAGARAALENPALPPSGSHESWMKVKLEEGWSYGPVKDVAAKTHPCLVAYDELPRAQKAKDALFLAAVRSYLDDYRACRLLHPPANYRRGAACR